MAAFSNARTLRFFSVFLGPPLHSIQVQVICWLILRRDCWKFPGGTPTPKVMGWFRRWVSGWCSNDSRRMFRLSLGHVFAAILGQKRNSMVWTKRSSYPTSDRFLSIHTSNNRSGLKAKSVNFSELGWDCDVKAKEKTTNFVVTDGCKSDICNKCWWFSIRKFS